MWRFALIVTITFFFINVSWAQEQQLPAFTSDSATFIQQLRTYFEDYQGRNPPEKSEIRKVTAHFGETWDLPTFEQDYKDLTVAMLNTMDSVGMRPIPHFRDFLHASVTCFHTRKGMAHYTQWLESLKPYLSRRKMRAFEKVLARWEAFFLDNSLAKNRVSDWHAEGDYTLVARPQLHLVYDEAILKGYANNDSTVIYGAKGTFLFDEAVWQGEKGVITWERAGFHKDSVYAVLPSYTLDLNTVNYSLDSVNFYHKALFGALPLLGVLQEKVMANVTPSKALYPLFASYDVRIPIPQLYEGMDYEGGFTMEGARIVGSGNNYKDAVLTIYRKEEPFMIVRSGKFAIKKDRLFAKSAFVVFYHDTDSVYHPNVSLSYRDKERTIRLSRGRDGTSQSPFADSFHKMDMFYGVLSWKIDGDEMILQPVKSNNNDGVAGFESWNYFSDYRFHKLQMLDELHPLVVIEDYTKKIHSNRFYFYEIAEYWRKPPAQVKAVLMNLANLGFLFYDAESEVVEVKDRLFHFLAAKNKKRDYDVISFNSSVKGMNHGELNLNTFDQKLRGVEHVFLSDSQRVHLSPAKREILLKKGGDFTFGGEIQAGLFDFYADSCSFEYDAFRLNMTHIDSLTFMVYTDEKDLYGNPVLKRVNTAIEDLVGFLLIDKPDNKSGLEDYPRYPIFTSLDSASVYYDNQYIQNGAYGRNTFYYKVDPFTFDSLNTFVASELEFKGRLKSSSIFPDIEQSLKIQKDRSLGFQTSVPEEGYPVYGDKGRFYDSLFLNNSGMHGSGHLLYLTSDLVSGDFIFFPDSMVTTIDTMTIARMVKEVEYPDTRISRSDILWRPYKDEMYIRNHENHPFSLYEGDVSLKGMLTYSPHYLLGDGHIAFGEAQMCSQRFDFRADRFITDSTTFELAAPGSEDLALSTHVYRSIIDFSSGTGLFRTQGKGSVVTFPVNKFACFMDEFDWDMEQNDVVLRNNIAMKMEGLDTLSFAQIMDVDFSGSEFVSLHPEQDSLRFFCLNANYDLKEKLISAKDVKLIRVGNGAIFPGSGVVKIYSNAELSPLTDAVIITDSLHKYHALYDVDVIVEGKYRMSGTGSYDYRDVSDKPHKIRFETLSIDSLGVISAKTRIPENRPFPVSPMVDFSGDITLSGDHEFLNFDGGFRLRQDCYEDDTWVKLNRRVDPSSVTIPSHDSLVDVKGDSVYTGVAFETIHNRIYPVFLGKLRKSTDFLIHRTLGEVTYDPALNMFSVRDTLRYKGFPEGGNYLDLNMRRCILEGQGEMDYGVLFPRVQFSSFGKVSHYIIPDSTCFEVVTGFSFFFNGDAFAELGRDLAETELLPVSLSRPTFLNALALMVAPREYKRIANDIALYGSLRRVPDALDFDLLFSDLKLSWNANLNAFVSHGPLGLAKVGKRQINKYVDGYVEIARKRTGDVFNIFLKVSEDTWYYFHYSEGVLQALSSNMKFNEALINVKEKQRKLKKKKNLPSYEYIISTTHKMAAFIEKMSASSPH
ncbi:MAG: hypothetical protein CSA95_06590 [Bacteroidetes bacterium]|nr:MAG: hypothetical protein CSA95_06590 [Bacteroidota bacterium]PIE87708.1 MAG: hypothetical protein CSA04_05640 [Bacteroidota bacterium]